MVTPSADLPAACTLPTEPGSDDGVAVVDDADAVFAGLGQARRLGRYTLLELLGRGGMGVVFSAYDAGLDRKVAIKFVRHGPDARARLMLLAEAQAQARLAHPNVIHVYEVGEHGDRVFLVMEFVRGPSLRTWLQAPRRWPEIVAMFVQAGRGLSAAHQAGLVHCDFKPDNVLVGADGRARVLDFGLARREDDAAAPAPFAAGTPGYIPPERYEDGAIDARGDQFGFCVALFEALYGQRPFAGETAAALMLQVVAGEVRGAPGEARVPARLRRAVRKGLARAPADRHASMAALLDELREALPRPRRAWLTVALVSAAVTSGAWALLLRDDAPPAVCAPAEPGWGPGPRAAVERAFAATGLAYAGDAFARTARLLDAHAEAWTAARRRACELALDGPGPLDRRRERCLDRRRRELTAWIDTLARADAAAVEQAVVATAELPGSADCVGPEALLGGDEPELAAATAAATAEIEGLLTGARANLRAGQYERGLPAAAAARRRARGLGLGRREADALLLLGLLHEHTGAGAQAQDSLAAAYFVADAAGHRGARAEAAVHLVHVTGGPPRAPETDALWARLAEASGAGLGEGALDLRASLLQHRSQAARARGAVAAARADLEAALALETRRLGPEHPALAAIHEQLGELERAAGRDDAALAHHARAVAVAEATLGLDHPSTARRILARGQVHEHRGDLAAALADDRRALASWELAYGDDHPRLIWPATCVGRVLAKAGAPAEAEPHYARALALAERHHGPGSAPVAAALLELAGLRRALGRAGEARALDRRALAILDATVGEAPARFDLAEALLADGELQAATRAFAQARGDPSLSGSRAALGRLGFALAQAQAAAGDAWQARRLGERAHADYRDAGEGHAAAREEVAAWLRQPDAPMR
ncbi:serine/threonine-protein kinase [Nannocystis bainbridge]|uniref:Serine/threonine-protein kinase n=1 Tax=Nannocystis bainbridge TaxID=2995303 RepID=A0ABT5EAI6_9BACT|nr:serine/threonine-protein kinase [Nannocystis bainbridge]MDC0722873.1 serine/threonine-protein kinase [Nannocystis bainbridge]